ncbi:hypothetical protein DFH28DRAFT_468317 [Melampsora americana]|nr:hypothetical protein DFH28DRAFT_468317 [Melampsora americana]
MLPFHQFNHNSNQDQKLEVHQNQNKSQSKFKHLNELNQLIKFNLNISNPSKKSNDQIKPSEQGTSKNNHHKTNWNELPIEIRLKILKFLNESYQTVIFSKNDRDNKEVSNHHSHLNSILSRGYLSKYLYVNKSFADLIRVFVWYAVNLSIASVPKLKEIEECVSNSSSISESIKSITFQWYQPRYNDIWENWYEAPMYESNLKILKSLKNLISLELILNDQIPYYSNLSISNEIKAIGKENLLDLLRFRLVTYWKVELDDEELMTDLLRNSTGLKRFECHSGNKGMKKLNIRVDELNDHSERLIPTSDGHYASLHASKKLIQSVSNSSRNAIIKGKQNQLEIRLPELLSTLTSLEHLAISTIACLDEDWNLIDWSQSRIKKLVLTDCKLTSWDKSRVFITCLSHTIEEIELKTQFGFMRRDQDESESSLMKEEELKLPKLKKLTIEIRVMGSLTEIHEDEVDFLECFDHEANRIEEVNLIEDCMSKLNEEIVISSLIQTINQILHFKCLKLIRFVIKLPKNYIYRLHLQNGEEDSDEMNVVDFTDPFKYNIARVYHDLKLHGIDFLFLL